jgi:hypothetical protein
VAGCTTPVPDQDRLERKPSPSQHRRDASRTRLNRIHRHIEVGRKAAPTLLPLAPLQPPLTFISCNVGYDPMGVAVRSMRRSIANEFTVGPAKSCTMKDLQVAVLLMEILPRFA